MSWLPVNFGKLSDLSDIADSFNKLSESVKNIELNFDTALGFENANATDGQNKQAKTEDNDAVAAAFKGLSRLSGVVGLTASSSQAAPTEEDGEKKGGAKPSVATRVAGSEPSPLTSEQVGSDRGEIRPTAADSLTVESASTSSQGKDGADRVDGDTAARGGEDESGDASELARGKVGEDTDRRAEDSEGTMEAEVLPSPTGRAVDAAHTHPSVASAVIAVAEGDEGSAESGDRGRAEHRGSEETGVPAENDQIITESTRDIALASSKMAAATISGIDGAAATSPESLAAKVVVDGATSLPKAPSDHSPKTTKGTADVIEPGDPELGDGGTKQSTGTRDESMPPPSPLGMADVDKGPTALSSQEKEELVTLRKDMEMMQTAVQSAAKQAQTKADELSRIMFLNDQLRGELSELKNKASNDAEMEMLKEEFQIRLGAAERKVYALTKERDMLKKEHSKSMDTSTLLKEKDEIIKQVMAEGEELSKKQATQELTIKKLRAQAAAREDTLRRDIEDLERRCQAAEQKHEELVSQMPDSTRPLLRQIEALQESLAIRAEGWKRVEQAMNTRVRAAEAGVVAAQEREQMMSERLSQTTSRLAVMEAQLSCLRAEHAQLSRALEKERQRAQENRQEYLAASEAAVTHEGRAKQLEEEIRELRIRHRKELAEERSRREAIKKEIEREKAVTVENEKRVQAEGRASAEKAVANAQQAMAKEQQQQQQQLQQQQQSQNRLRRMSSSSSAGSIEESFLLQASLQGSPVHISSSSTSNGPVAPVLGGRLVKGPSTLEQMDLLLRQKEGELASYASRLAALESTRDSLAEELVKSTTQCESYKAEASSLPGLRAELEALRKRHASALELMGERDEQVEELRADLADIKQMYREQIDMLVNQIERMSAQLDASQRTSH
ncbi:hypothetical protein CBR_g16051 [Chara braunii]|uniref:TATA element modulatory factor 1 TATA binding domain-containing protein n=1 Tax=Chara braunii TaxID=69332 RepID=A0A388JSY0_CHABU|nr:hypothetical protein CBR_g16051 [Chara braunii]|eukprot:GBG60929.1 hypothetical protein CBR_g16051 [Chara braunii]